MHRLATTPGGWTPDAEGVIFVDQSPASIIVLTAADTDIQTLAAAAAQMPPDFPSVRVTSLLQLQQQLSIDTYADETLRHARVLVLRLLGGRAYWPYGLEVIKQLAQDCGIHLFVIPGDDRPDPDLISHSTQPLVRVNQLWRYFTEGGVENGINALTFLSDLCLGTTYGAENPQEVPRVGGYRGWEPRGVSSGEAGREGVSRERARERVGVLFYRAHYLAGNTAPVNALCQALAQRGLECVPLYVSSLRDAEVEAAVLDAFKSQDREPIRVVLNTTSFAIARLNEEALNLELWRQLDVPVIQVILSGGTQEQWEEQWRGLSPRDMAMNVALPEVDGRIISRAVSFKSVQSRDERLETDVVTYKPVGDRINFVADLALNWVRLSQTPIQERRIALILANYPTRDGRLANGVGLDTPASCIQILKALKQAGYTVEHIPEDGDALIRELTRGVTNDPEARDLRSVRQTLGGTEYWDYFDALPESVQQGVRERWGSEGVRSEGVRSEGDGGDGNGGEAGESTQGLNPGSRLTAHGSPPTPPSFPISGLQLGNVFVGIQPARGYDVDPALNYHAPDLEPTHDYLAFYHWVRSHFGAQAIAHVGKHGNLEWLPGKGVALSESCYPEVAFGPMPHLYPFIVNDPGEGAQAKRRSQAVVIDHLTPPMTRAELYGYLHQLEGLIDEFYEAQSLDPARVPVIRDRIQALIQQEKLDRDLGLALESDPSNSARNSTSKNPVVNPSGVNPSGVNPSIVKPSSDLIDDFIARADGYLCELKEAQIRDGLHIFGQCPTGRQLRDLVVAIARHPAPGRKGLTRAIAADWHLDLDPLTADPAQPFTTPPTAPHLSHCRTIGDAIETIEHHATHLITPWLPTSSSPSSSFSSSPPPSPSPALSPELTWIQTHLLPALRNTDQEIIHLLRGLDGRYIPSGPSGAPTRGRADVLPTGRNFYSVDIRAIPTESAWDVGRKAAEILIERYTQENGDYPKTLGLSVWGTSTMRTGGDDIAEALALLGVQPVWDGPSRRVVDFEILPLSVMNRPRVDVTLRVSGFFRDGFDNLIDLFQQAVEAVAALDEPEEWNPLAAQVRRDVDQWQQAGLAAEQARERSHYRVFGSKPGAYGAGLQGLIDAQNWTSDEDLARAYINWSSYAYTGRGDGKTAPDAFEQRLRHMQIVLHNQDNREHDLLDSDDYYQFQGGLTAAVRSVQGHNPTTYFGDHSIPENPRVRHLREELARVYRSRVVNPKWIAGAMRHGYKGAFEMAATVDYLFAYDATTRCVDDHMYDGVTQAYVLDPTVQQFIQEKNPWALRDMAERLLEAHQRGLWTTLDAKRRDELRAIAHQAEAEIEGMNQSV